VPLELRDADVEALLPPADAVAAVEEWLAQPGAEAPRARLPLPEGELTVGAAADERFGLGLAQAGPLAVLVDRAGRPAAVLETHRLRALVAGALTAVALGRLARRGAASIGLIGTGAVGAAVLACLRATRPELRRTVAYSRDPERLAAFCAAWDAEPGEYNRDAAEQDVVVTATTSRDPVLRGEWLQPGALVCALGATRPGDRELDNAVLQRASFVCVDLLEAARRDAGDLIEPVERGVLDWLEVHELAEVVHGHEPGRGSDADVVVFKSVGPVAAELALAALAVERARA
jgi:alanine dehydrogenase